jgi:hypothetical protein
MTDIISFSIKCITMQLSVSNSKITWLIRPSLTCAVEEVVEVRSYNMLILAVVAFLSNHFSAKVAYGVDISPHQIATAQAKFEREQEDQD